MKRQITSAIKTDIFEKASRQAAINDLYKGLMIVSRAMDAMSNEDFDKMNLSNLYQEVLDKIQDVAPYAKY